MIMLHMNSCGTTFEYHRAPDWTTFFFLLCDCKSRNQHQQIARLGDQEYIIGRLRPKVSRLRRLGAIRAQPWLLTRKIRRNTFFPLLIASCHCCMQSLKTPRTLSFYSSPDFNNYWKQEVMVNAELIVGSKIMKVPATFIPTGLLRWIFQVCLFLDRVECQSSGCAVALFSVWFRIIWWHSWVVLTTSPEQRVPCSWCTCYAVYFHWEGKWLYMSIRDTSQQQHANNNY